MEPETSGQQQPSPLQEPPSADVPVRRDLWTYWDLTGFVLFATLGLFVCSLLAVVLSSALSNFLGVEAPLTEAPSAVYWALGIQLVWWGLNFLFFYYVVAIKYRLPFGRALGFVPYRAPTAWFAVFGLMLAFGVGITGQLIGAPTETPFSEMLGDPDTLWLMGIFAVLIGPVIEEIAFRGFLFRPIERAHGGLAAIIVTSAIFTVPHGDQYDWSWQILILLLTAGAAFGIVRWATGSLWPAIIMHISYNGVQFLAFAFSEQLGIE